MDKKKSIILGIVIWAISLLVIGWRLYIFRYEDCMFTVEENMCDRSCNFKSVVTHHYCG